MILTHCNYFTFKTSTALSCQVSYIFIGTDQTIYTSSVVIHNWQDFISMYTHDMIKMYLSMILDWSQWYTNQITHVQHILIWTKVGSK